MRVAALVLLPFMVALPRAAYAQTPDAGAPQTVLSASAYV